MKTDIRILIAIMKELGLNELTVKPATVMRMKPEDSINVYEPADGSIVLKLDSPAGAINVDSCGFSDVKSTIAGWLSKSKPVTFTLDQILSEVFSINPEIASHTQRERIGLALSELGWKRTSRNKVNGKRQFMYSPRKPGEA